MYKSQKLCDCCKKNIANYFYKEYVNGQKLDIALCEECNANSNIAEHYNVFMSSLFNDFMPSPYQPLKVARKTCKCGCTEEDILSTGRFGCSECYKTFSNIVDAYVNKLGGRTYAGKMPEHVITKSVKVPTLDEKIQELQAKMNAAAKAENYVLAKQYKDELQKLLARRG